MRTARRSVPCLIFELPAVVTDLVKVVDLNSALAKLSGGDPNLTGFFLTKTDLGDVTTSQQMIDAAGLDYPGSPFSGGAPHVVIETKMSTPLASEARIPRDGGYLDGSPAEFQVPANSRGYPNTGNGMIASRDGRLRTESIMRTGAPMDTEITVMKFRNADGTSNVVTAGGQSASDWALRQIEPGNPQAGYRWDPLP